MATTEVWDNDDGLVIKFGTERSKQPRAGEVRVAGPVHTRTMDVDFSDLQNNVPGAGFDVDSDLGGTFDSFSGMQAFIPANSLVVRSTFFALTDWADSTGTMDIDVGTYRKDGTVIVDDDLHSAILEAELDAGDLHVGDGGAIGADIGVFDAYIVVEQTAGSVTLTSGTARLVVEYIPPLA